MFDFHMHSDFSADCSVAMEDMICRAIDKGLTEICFTEHIDYEYPDKDFIFEFDLQAYDKRIKNLQQKYADQITVRKGIELGLQPYLLDRYDRLMATERFDFSILSIHTADKKGLHDEAFLQIDRLKRLTKSIMRNYYTASKTLSSLVYLAILILLKDIRLMRYRRQIFMASFRKFSKKSFR